MSEEKPHPRSIVYCGICSFPPEYCEFGGKFVQCKAWLEDAHPELYEKLYLSGSQETKASSTLPTEKQEQIEKDLQKLQIKEAKKAERELQKKLSSKIIIKKIERTKRKRVISISGLEVFDLNIKKLSKQFSSKFATGASVVKNAEKKEDLVLQGDLADECEEFIHKLLEEQGLKDVKVEMVEDKKKKKPAQPTV
ncbi:Tma22 protein [Saccharomycopsis crataegensis]|uniref:Translation machinery-associated protein 22 n=1 Tax=Saccharomycopsis crataegensis TaxID=43959 RepID=A0AAV5QEC3_9ASCO|nr:Tma22 protein [Saccharomycopsis crataegensis]